MKKPAPKRLKKAKPAASAAPDPTATPSSGVLVPTVVLNSKCYALRYWAHDEALFGRDPELVLSGEFILLATRLKVGDRIFLQAWEGGALTGRARLCTVTRLHTFSDVNPPAYDVGVLLQQTWAWSQGAAVETLKALSWVPEALELPVYSPTKAPSFEGLTLQTTTAEEKLLLEIIPTKEGFKKLCDELEDADLVNVCCERRTPR